MNDWLAITGALVGGGLLGLVFFWGLWTTVDRLTDRRRPTLWVLGSLLLRFAVILGAFYLLVQHGRWHHVLVAAVAFALVRWWLVRHLATRRAGRQSGT
ncbi:MAG: ATP synthase subunit I [Gammaproteobacteria bacterium]